MRLYEKEIMIPLKKGHKDLISYFKEYVSNQLSDEIPIRFVVTKTNNKGYYCELGVLSEINNNIPKIKSIFEFKKRDYEKNDKFNAVLVIPTGVDAELGGHAGDANALAKLAASTCDTLITHPNVVNASDINEMTENTLYVEGSILSRLMMGTIGLQKVKSNRLKIIVDEHEDKFFTQQAINAVSSARASLGLSYPKTLVLKDKFKMKSDYAKSGRAIGIIENLDGIYNILKAKKGDYDAVAISSLMEIPPGTRKSYYSGEGIANPWGGAEAILTHTISSLFDIPSAHSPMMDSKKILNLYWTIIEPRKAAEMISITFFYSVLKGLHKSPKIISDSELIDKPGIINASDISCLIIPDKCIGLPTLAALEQGIPVIAVKNKNIMQNNLEDLPWAEGQLIKVDNYLEAVGVMNTLKAGISVESVRRPLKNTKVI